MNTNKTTNRNETARTSILDGAAWKCEHCGDIHWHGNHCGCKGANDEAGVVAASINLDDIELDLGE